MPIITRTGGCSQPCSTEYFRKKTAAKTSAMPAIGENNLTPTRLSQSNAGFAGSGGTGGGGVRGGRGGGAVACGMRGSAVPTLADAAIAAGTGGETGVGAT